MSVLCCHIPDFLIRLYQRRHTDRGGYPLALLGSDERIWAVSPEAEQSGVLPEMIPRQARMRCPDLRLCPLDDREAESEQDQFLAVLNHWGLPVESLGWGAAYLDLHWLATEKAKVRPFCEEMGRALRAAMGDLLQPSLGWDSGKFTARAAAVQTEPGRMRLVDKKNEVRFLAPLPISLLPLPPQDLQRLRWLGIRTLGQYAQLPEVSVWQRFGRAGKLSWRWAQGKDERPVQSTMGRLPDPLTVDFESPEGNLGPVLDAIIIALRPTLAQLMQELMGVRHLRIQLHFLDASTCVLDATFVEAEDREERLLAVLRHKLETSTWPAEVEGVTLWVLETGERPIRQPMLFPELEEAEDQPLTELAQTLRRRYGCIFYRGVVVDPKHPVAERRVQYQLLVS